jgi:hypothetical protein
VSSSRPPAFPPTRRRKAAAWCLTIFPLLPVHALDRVQGPPISLSCSARAWTIISHAAAPRFNAEAKIARIDIDANEIATTPRKIDIGIVGDCKMVLDQLLTGMMGKVDPDRFKIGASGSPMASPRT